MQQHKIIYKLHKFTMHALHAQIPNGDFILLKIILQNGQTLNLNHLTISHFRQPV